MVYTNADYRGDIDGTKSCDGYVVMLKGDLIIVSNQYKLYAPHPFPSY